MATQGALLLRLSVLAVLLGVSLSWEQDELDLFDLVEEVGENFYEVLQVKESATAAEIRRAYRALSLQYHPDKTDSPQAAEKFRKLAAVAEVLKDKEQRAHYDLILAEGLPDWRQPVFYYRRVRKMGLLEIGCLMLLIATVAHYLFGWAMYLEKWLVLQELIQKKEKKEASSRRSRQNGRSTVSSRLEADLMLVTAQASACVPKLRNLLPLMLAKKLMHALRLIWTWYQQRQVDKTNRSWSKRSAVDCDVTERPTNVGGAKKGGGAADRKMGGSARCAQRRSVGKAAADGGSGERVAAKHERKSAGEVEVEVGGLEAGRTLVHLHERMGREGSRLQEGGAAGRGVLNSHPDVARGNGSHNGDTSSVETSESVTATPGGQQPSRRPPAPCGQQPSRQPPVTATPGGQQPSGQPPVTATPGGQQPSRQPPLLTTPTESQCVHTGAVVPSPKPAVALVGKGTTELPPNSDNSATAQSLKLQVERNCDLDASEQRQQPGGRSACGNSTPSAGGQKQHGSGQASAPVSAAWSQSQQKQLEWALVQYPRLSKDRWDNISRAVPGKTKVECVERCRELSEAVITKRRTHEVA